MSSLRTANSVVGLALWGKMWEKVQQIMCGFFFIKIQFISNLKRKKSEKLKPFEAIVVVQLRKFALFFRS